MHAVGPPARGFCAHRRVWVLPCSSSAASQCFVATGSRDQSSCVRLPGGSCSSYSRRHQGRSRSQAVSAVCTQRQMTTLTCRNALPVSSTYSSAGRGGSSSCNSNSRKLQRPQQMTGQRLQRRATPCRSCPLENRLVLGASSDINGPRQGHLCECKGCMSTHCWRLLVRAEKLMRCLWLCHGTNIELVCLLAGDVGAGIGCSSNMAPWVSGPTALCLTHDCRDGLLGNAPHCLSSTGHRGSVLTPQQLGCRCVAVRVR